MCDPIGRRWCCNDSNGIVCSVYLYIDSGTVCCTVLMYRCWCHIWYGTYASVTIAYVVLCLCIGNHNVCGIVLILGRGAVCGTVLVLIHQQRYQCGLIEPICLRKNFMVLSVKSQYRTISHWKNFMVLSANCNIFSNKNCIKKSHWKNFMVLSVKRILSTIFALKKSWFFQLSGRHSNPKTHTLLYVI